MKIDHNSLDGDAVMTAVPSTQMNIYYKLGVAQALGKETLVVKSPGAKLPSDFVRTEYV